MNGPSETVPSQPQLVSFHQQDAIATLRLNQPATRNALSTTMMTQIQAHLDRIKQDRSIYVVVLEAEGPVFSSGHNLKEMRADSRKEVMQELFDQCSHMMLSFTTLPQPVIAKVDGLAAAAGCQLVATCDLAYVSETSQFLTPGVNMGLFCSTPMVALSRNVSPKHALEMLLTGETVDAAHAQRIGLVNKVVPAHELDAAVQALAARIASKSPLIVKIGKEAFYHQYPLPLAQAYEYTAQVMSENMQAEDALEGIDAILQKRDPVWKGK